MYSKLTTRGHPVMCFKDICKHDLKFTDIDPDNWELFVNDCSSWYHVISKGFKRSKCKNTTTGRQKTMWKTEAENSSF